MIEKNSRNKIKYFMLRSFLWKIVIKNIYVVYEDRI